MPIVPYRENPNHVDAAMPAVAPCEIVIAGDAKSNVDGPPDTPPVRKFAPGFQSTPQRRRWLSAQTFVRHYTDDCPAAVRAGKLIEFAAAHYDACPGWDCKTPACKRAKRRPT